MMNRFIEVAPHWCLDWRAAQAADALRSRHARRAMAESFLEADWHEHLARVLEKGGRAA